VRRRVLRAWWRSRRLRQVSAVGGGSNLLQASCTTTYQGPAAPGQPRRSAVTLTFSVTGKQVATYTDTNQPFTDGYTGVVTLTGKSTAGTFTVTFERFSAHQS
jgi:hypothetical protein